MTDVRAEAAGQISVSENFCLSSALHLGAVVEVIEFQTAATQSRRSQVSPTPANLPFPSRTSAAAPDSGPFKDKLLELTAVLSSVRL